ncbi:TetR family transcriptional regulator [Leptolyngbya sp. GB1-A1]|uniref:TetR family transcriptional regulator n=1 Tax=Leptolyngbya sp. GB1-A1 TaxID=2933908 RepID=UPI003296911E
MSDRPRSSERLLQAAVQLFVSQGITATTTRQIAELAGVNEVTLFRQFGNKQGLLLAILKDGVLLTPLGAALGQQAAQATNFEEALKHYGQMQLAAIDGAPELLRSLIGEAGQYSSETAQALGQTLQEINCYTAEYLATVLQHQPPPSLPIAAIAALLNRLLLGDAVLNATAPSDGLRQDRAEFLDQLVMLFQSGALISSPHVLSSSPALITEADLPDGIVHSLLQQAKKTSLQDYAIAYVLFAAGLSAAEVAGLSRSHLQIDPHQMLLKIDRGELHQVPLNQWILGQRYGSHKRNPLTQWLKSRKDDQSAVFINEAGRSLSEVEVRLRWQEWTANLSTNQPPVIEQAQSTWCVEMLTRGMNLEELSLLTGFSIAQLQSSLQRAKEKAVLERVLQLDQKLGKNATP